MPNEDEETSTSVPDETETNEDHDDDDGGEVVSAHENDENLDEHLDELGTLRDDDVELGHPDHMNTIVPVSQVKHRRLSHAMDLATGKLGGARAHKAKLRSSDSCKAMDAGIRRRNSLWSRIALFKKDDDEYNETSLNISMHGRLQVTQSLNSTEFARAARGSNPQYRLEAIKPSTRGACFWKLLGFSDGTVNIYEDANNDNTGTYCFGLSPNRIVMQYLHWTFRSSFFEVFLSAAVSFFSITIIFALLIWAMGVRHPTCIGGVDVDGTFFTDAFILSWTTFSTVGYGLIYPGISSTEQNGTLCVGITILSAMESFVGVLFGSLCGAVIFAKVSRIQSFAKVSFSDPIVVRYGCGVTEEQNVEDEDKGSQDDGSGAALDEDSIPCPVIEFRLFNGLSETVGGEIIDATISLVASIDASQASAEVRNAIKRKRGAKKGKGGGRLKKALSFRERSERKIMKEKGAELLPHSPIHTAPRTHQAFEEDPTGHLVPKRIFSKLEVESPDHPYFKRVWMIRHRLDKHSPLLKTHARQMVKDNGGYWPMELNSAEAVRASIHFDQILVSFSGTSNADANSVYAQKVYDFVDVNVGYQFVNALFRDDDDGRLCVDGRLMNDVLEQAGGGGEPFSIVHGEKLSDMLML